MANSTDPDLQDKMQILAQQAVIAVFTRLMRIRIATQTGYQRAMTFAILESEFSDALRDHESQVLVDNKLTERGVLFRESFELLSGDLMRDVAGGLTDDERRGLATE